MVDEQPEFVTPPANSSLFFRLAWMAAVPAILLCIFVVANTSPWTFTRYDIAVAASLLAGIAARAADTFWFEGTTAYGDRSTTRDVVLYAVRIGLATAVAWVSAQSIGL